MRSKVPRLPGSRTPSGMSTKSGVGGKGRGCSVSATSSPWGVSVSLAAFKTDSAAVSTGTPRAAKPSTTASPRSLRSSPCSTSWAGQPACRASSARRTPSTTKTPSERRALGWVCSLRSHWILGLWTEVIMGVIVAWGCGRVKRAWIDGEETILTQRPQRRHKGHERGLEKKLCVSWCVLCELCENPGLPRLKINLPGWEGPGRDGALCEESDDQAAFAWAATAAKACGSRTAMSASILRLMAMLATFMPCIIRL